MACSRRWNKPGIPHSGWSYIGVFDLGEPTGNCGMCNNSIRYVHTVNHAEYGELEVGVQCAEKMTDGNGPEARELHLSSNSAG